MSWSNKRRIHLARGTTNNILAISTNNIDDPNLFTDGQPLFNKDRGYLGIAKNKQSAKDIEPIKVRMVEGWGNEIDNGLYILKSENEKNNYYRLTGDALGTYLSSTADFVLQRVQANNTYTPIFTVGKENSLDYLDVNVPIKTNSNIIINDQNNQKYLSSFNIKTRNIQYLNNSDTYIRFYNDSLRDGLSNVYLIDPGSNPRADGLAPLTNYSGVSIRATDGFLLDEDTTFVSQRMSNLFGVTSIWGKNYMYGDTTILPAMTWHSTDIPNYCTYQEDTAYNNKLLIGVPTEIKAPLELGRLKIRGSSFYTIPGYGSSTNNTETKISGLDKLLCTNIGGSDSKVSSIYTVDLNADNATFSNKTSFNGDISNDGHYTVLNKLAVGCNYDARNTNYMTLYAYETGVSLSGVVRLGASNSRINSSVFCQSKLEMGNKLDMANYDIENCKTLNVSTINLKI